MGADFLLYAVPSCELTAKRRLLAEQAIHGITKDDTLAVINDLEGLLDETDEKETDTICADFKKQLIKDLDFFVAPKTREVTDWIPPGCDRGFLITGGMSWGDRPTEAAEIFDRMAACRVLWDLFNQWAVEDERQRRAALRTQNRRVRPSRKRRSQRRKGSS